MKSSDCFWIQAGNPTRISKLPGFPDELSSIIQDRFSLKSENLVMFWANVPVPLCYKYDLSVMIDEILEMLESLLDPSFEEVSILFPSDTFEARWRIARALHDRIRITAQWTSVHRGINVNDLCIIEMAREDFLAEWKRPLSIIFHAISDAANIESLPSFQRLVAVREAIPVEGRLYRPSNEL